MRMHNGNYIYIQDGEAGFTPFNPDPTSATAHVYPATESVLFPDSTFAIELKIVITRDNTAHADQLMKIKLQVFACFERGQSYIYTYILYVIWSYNNDWMGRISGIESPLFICEEKVANRLFLDWVFVKIPNILFANLHSAKLVQKSGSDVIIRSFHFVVITCTYFPDRMEH